MSKRLARRHLLAGKSVTLWGDIPVNIEQLQVHELSSVLSKNPSQYAVEERINTL